MQIIFQRISPIQVRKTHSLLNVCNQKLRSQLGSDIVSFHGNNDLLDLPDELIFEKIKAAREDVSCFLGEGSEARVHKIPDTDYCVRFSYKDFDDIDFFSHSGNKILDRDLNESDKINHVVAKFGNCSTIMQHIEGKPIAATAAELRTAQCLKTVEEIAKMPIESFNRFLKQICYAHSNNMMFDNIWTNVIVNPRNKSITAIDFYKNKYNEILNPLCHMYVSLVPSCSTTKQRKIIANKILNAAIDEFKPAQSSCWTFSKSNFLSLLALLKSNYSISLDDGSVESLKIMLDSLIELKKADLRGVDVTKNLLEQINQSRILIENVF